MIRFGKKIPVLLAFLFCLSSAFSQGIVSPVVKIPFPAGTLGWNNDDSKYALGEDNVIFVRDSSTSEVTHILPFKNIIRLSFADEAGTDMLLALAANGSASIWNVRENTKDFQGISSVSMPDYSISITSTNNHIVSAALSKNSNHIAAAFDDGTVAVFFKLRYTQNLVSSFFPGHTSPAYSLEFSRDDRYVVSASKDNRVIAWNMATGEMTANFQFYGDSGAAALFADSPDHIVCCTSPDEVSVCSLDGTSIHTFQTGSRVKNIELSRDCKTLIVLTEDNRLRIFDMQTFENAGYIPAYNLSQVTSFAFNSNGSQVLVGHADGSVYRLNVDEVFLFPDQEPPEILSLTDTDVVRKGFSHSPKGINTHSLKPVALNK
ncbi:MAG: hypothetical protein J6Y93_05670 [Treponema sp.]|nr:hypothetical protein [Treponema sp.]